MVKLWTQPSHAKLAPREVAKEGRDCQRGTGHVRVGVAGQFTVNDDLSQDLHFKCHPKTSHRTNTFITEGIPSELKC